MPLLTSTEIWKCVAMVLCISFFILCAESGSSAVHGFVQCQVLNLFKKSLTNTNYANGKQNLMGSNFYLECSSFFQGWSTIHINL